MAKITVPSIYDVIGSQRRRLLIGACSGIVALHTLTNFSATYTLQYLHYQWKLEQIVADYFAKYRYCLLMYTPFPVKILWLDIDTYICYYIYIQLDFSLFTHDTGRYRQLHS